MLDGRGGERLASGRRIATIEAEWPWVKSSVRRAHSGGEEDRDAPRCSRRRWRSGGLGERPPPGQNGVIVGGRPHTEGGACGARGTGCGRVANSRRQWTGGGSCRDAVPRREVRVGCARLAGCLSHPGLARGKAGVGDRGGLELVGGPTHADAGSDSEQDCYGEVQEEGQEIGRLPRG